MNKKEKLEAIINTNDQDFLNHLFDDLTQDIQIKIDQIETFLLESDLKGIRKVLNTLKTTTSYFNYNFMWEAVCLLETAVDRNDIKMTTIYLDILREEKKRLKKNNAFNN